jgi:hypothetical protein
LACLLLLEDLPNPYSSDWAPFDELCNKGTMAPLGLAESNLQSWKMEAKWKLRNVPVEEVKEA